MQEFRTYSRPNLKKFTRYFLFFLLLILLTVQLWFPFFGRSRIGVALFGRFPDSICQTEENKPHTRNSPRKRRKARQKPVVANASRGKKRELPIPSKHIGNIQYSSINNLWDKKIEVARFQASTRKKEVLRKWKPKRCFLPLRHDKHKNNIGLCYKPFINKPITY